MTILDAPGARHSNETHGHGPLMTVAPGATAQVRWHVARGRATGAVSFDTSRVIVSSNLSLALLCAAMILDRVAG